MSALLGRCTVFKNSSICRSKCCRAAAVNFVVWFITRLYSSVPVTRALTSLICFSQSETSFCQVAIGSNGASAIWCSYQERNATGLWAPQSLEKV